MHMRLRSASLALSAALFLAASAHASAGPGEGIDVRSMLPRVGSPGIPTIKASESKFFTTRSGERIGAHGWKGSLGLSYVEARGVTRSRSLSVSANAVRVAGPWRTALDAKYTLGSAEGVTATDIARAEAKLDRSLSQRSYGYGSAVVFRDGVSDIDPRVTAGAGGGYRFLKSRKHDLSAEAGYEFLSERVGGAPFDDNSFARLAANYSLKAGEGRVFTEKAEVSRALSGESRTRARSETSLTAMFNRRLSLKIGFVLEYDTEPPAGAPRMTTQAETALVLSF